MVVVLYLASTTYRLLYSWNEPPSSSRIFANRTAFKNGTSTNSSKLSSTENLYFFFFIMNAIPGAPGPINVIHTILFKNEAIEKNLYEIWCWIFDCLVFVLFIFLSLFFTKFSFGCRIHSVQNSRIDFVLKRSERFNTILFTGGAAAVRCPSMHAD